MRLPTTHCALAACGSDEVFELQLGFNERLIDASSTAQLANDRQGIESLTVVGDLDGDGIDDAVIRGFARVPNDDTVEFNATVYVLYGGSNATGEIDFASLPTLTDAGDGATAGTGGVFPAGDVDGDGRADFLVGSRSIRGCFSAGANNDVLHSGAYLVYGSSTRLSGVKRIADAGAFLRDPTPCTGSGQVRSLGDIDGDGKADLAIAKATSPTPASDERIELQVFYGRGEQLTGTVDLDALADATLVALPPETSGRAYDLAGISFEIPTPVGDVDGDGYDDFLLASPGAAFAADLRLVKGAATRLTGTVMLPDITASRFLGAALCPYSAWNFFEITRRGDLPGAALGDLDGDGFADFSLLSCTYTDPTGGRFPDVVERVQHIFYGRAAGFPAQLSVADSDAAIHLAGGTHPADAGPTHLATGDVDGDGVLDLVLSDAGLHLNNGGVQVIAGNGTRLSGVVDTALRGVTYVGRPAHALRCDDFSGPGCTAPQEIGADLAVGDLTGDHRADILVSAPTDQSVAPDLAHAGSSTARAYLVSPAARNQP